jgi:hypothetical protein
MNILVSHSTKDENQTQGLREKLKNSTSKTNKKPPSEN